MFGADALVGFETGELDSSSSAGVSMVVIVVAKLSPLNLGSDLVLVIGRFPVFGGVY